VRLCETARQWEFIIRLFQLVFSAGTVFFSHNKSASSVFQPAYQPSRTGPMDTLVLVTEHEHAEVYYLLVLVTEHDSNGHNRVSEL
jgi:hypothetical protein